MNNFLSFIEDASTVSPLIVTGFILMNSAFLTMHVIYYYICIGILLLLDGVFKAVYKRNNNKEGRKKYIISFLLIINSSMIIIISIAEFLTLQYGL